MTEAATTTPTPTDAPGHWLLLGDEGAGKTTFLRQLAATLADPLASRLDAAVVFDAGSDLREPGPDGYPGPTAFATRPYPATARTRGGRGLRFTVVDGRGDGVRVPAPAWSDGREAGNDADDAEPAEALLGDLAGRAEVVMLLIGPGSLDPGGRAPDALDHLAHRAGEAVAAARARGFACRVQVLFTRADEYGVADPGPARLTAGPRAGRALSAFAGAPSGALARRWADVLAAAAEPGPTGDARALRAWLLDRTRPLWDALLRCHGLQAGRHVDAYVVAARPVGPDGRLGGPGAGLGVVEAAADALAFAARLRAAPPKSGRTPWAAGVIAAAAAAALWALSGGWAR